jgi:hypothetical protein
MLIRSGTFYIASAAPRYPEELRREYVSSKGWIKVDRIGRRLLRESYFCEGIL